MKFCKLRIVWSVTWGLLAVLLVVLWVRSYWTYDQLSVLQGNGGWSVVVSARGQMRWGNNYFGDYDSSWSVVSKSVNNPALITGECLDYPTIPSYRGLILRDDYNHTYVPHWYAIFAFGTLASIPWLRWRFSLRTLLIAMTLVAAVLGLIVWASR
jgi:hypothetical protein